MKKDEIYFGEAGLTSTSANYIANKAKEIVAGLEAELNDVTFITTTVSLLDSQNPAKIISKSVTADEISQFKDKLDKIAKMKSLCAWLREAIKAKRNLSDEITCTTTNKWAEMTGVQMPVQPTRPNRMTADDYLATLSVKDRNKYLELETECAVYGKFIHTDGALYKARKHYNKHLKHQTEIVGEGHDTLIKEFLPGVESSVIEETFFDLNDTYRKMQSELNSMKHACETWIDEQNEKLDTEYKVAYEKYRNEFDIKIAEYSSWVDRESNKVSAYKIIIPNSLKDTYEYVNKL